MERFIESAMPDGTPSSNSLVRPLLSPGSARTGPREGASGAGSYIAEIEGIENQYTMTAAEVFSAEKEIIGKRVLVIGGGQSGLKIAEFLGRNGYDVVVTKRDDPIGGMMDGITRAILLGVIDTMPNVSIMPHTTVVAFSSANVEFDLDGTRIFLKPFATVVLANGMV
jgi:pyruvate/2-oxoglutarate dehydrogenase complex dihydrolipoamide dehydrogenase (E3) component